MENKTNNAETEMSLSKQRKIQRKIDIEKAKRNRLIGKIVGWVVLALLVIAAGVGLFFGIRRAATAVTEVSNYSQGLDANGKIEGIKATDYVKLPQYKGVEVAYSSIKLSDEDLEKKIESIRSSHAAQSTTTDKEVAKDDVIVVEYKSYYEDGTEVKDGATGESGATITVGSSSLKDYGFDDALIGKKISTDTFVVEVTFPETYTTNKDLAGKKIKYVTAIKSIKITPEFDDALVKEHYSKYASTADEYRAYIKSETERETLENLIVEKIIAGATVEKYPSKYMKTMKGILKYNAIQSYTYYANLYAQYGLSSDKLSSFEAYVGMSMAKFDRSLVESAEQQVKVILVYQAIAELENITADIAEYRAYYVEKGGDASTFDTNLTSYGHNSMVQQYLQTKVIKAIVDSVVVTGKE